jgi:hypothetical protein
MSQVAHASKNIKGSIKPPIPQQKENIFAGIRHEEKALRGAPYVGVPKHVKGARKEQS